MCDPVSLTAATVAISAATTGLAFQGAKEQARGARQAANLTFAQGQNELGQRSAQIDAQQSENTVEGLIAAAQQRGAISASASDLGYSGSTTARIANAADFEAGRGMSIADLNSENQRLEAANISTGQRITRSSTIAANKGPSTAVLGLALAGDVIGGATTYTKLGGTLPGKGAKSKVVK
ncbi:MAG: hypothetical protein WA154_12920 [Moraxellaceae bacterium]